MEPLITIRPELLSLSHEQFCVLSPYILVLLGSIITIFGCILKRVSPKWPVFLVTIATFLGGIYLSASHLGSDSVILFNGMMVADSYSHFFNIIFMMAGLVTVLSSLRYLDREGLQYPEYNVLILFSTLGMMLLSSSLDLIVLFIALELMSLAVYILVGFRRSDRKSNEAAMKYFVLGSAASAILLYGVALLYGCSGSTDMRVILSVVQGHPTDSAVLMLGVAAILVGLLFKVAAAPFHMWMPDVYEGAPVPITGYMTTGLKAAAFATLFRVFTNLGLGHGLLGLLERHIHDVLWVVAVLTMVAGNFIALAQMNLKRILAYSSIAHTGYLLVGVIAGAHNELGFAPGVFYLASYVAMNLGAFLVLAVIAERNDSGLNLKDLSGFSQKHPGLSFAMAVFLFSMAGIPPTAGFVAKYFVLYSAVQANEILLVVLTMLCSAVSVFYYLRILVYMYMKDPEGSPATIRVSWGSGIALSMMVILTLKFGILPDALMSLAQRVVAHF